MRLSVSVLGAWIVAGCNLDPYPLFGNGGDDDGGIGDDGGNGDGGNRPDARVPVDARVDTMPDACVPQQEVCNGVDDDCDSLVDMDDPDITEAVQSNPSHCGACGHACDLPNTNGTCSAGVCQFTCRACFHDVNDDIVPPVNEATSNGCEYSCCLTNDGVEECDGIDNDCDMGRAGGGVDEDFDIFGGDVNNCGACNRVCTVLHATPVCNATGVDGCPAPGGCCDYSTCEAGYEDIIPGIPGCEYLCPNPSRPAEICDGVDQDCDGVVDNGNPGGGANCGTDVGVCEFGTTTCVAGVLLCVGGTPPATVDPCDGLDNNCNGTVDDGFDKDTDPNHCGPTCMVCNLPNAIEGCSGGVCTIASCAPGWRNTDGVTSNGCEHNCTPTGPEICDGRDNDCDLLVDTADPGLVAVTNFCQQQGACAGTQPICDDTACEPGVIRWRCIYAGQTERDACGNLVAQEVVCNDVDGDCDGVPDDGFLDKGLPCDDGELGVCRGTGTYDCNTAGDDVECVIPPGQGGASPGPDVCDGIDQNCDGILDNGPNLPSTTPGFVAVNTFHDLVHVVSGGMNFYIFRYEASRPNASMTDSGNMEHRPCSKPTRVPWASADWNEANAACAAAAPGFRLCTEAEWQLACGGAANQKYPYHATTYDADACNGEDNDVDCAMPDEDERHYTGRSYGCPSPLMTCQSPPFAGGTTPSVGAIDMSGNLKEWTSTQVSSSPVAYRIRGGAYDTIAPGLTCDFDFVAGEPDYYFTNLGFRCCKTGP